MGRLDAFVQSTDKNFLVPVGGCVVASPKEEFINTVSQTYPGNIPLLIIHGYVDISLYRSCFSNPFPGCFYYITVIGMEGIP